MDFDVVVIGGGSAGTSAARAAVAAGARTALVNDGELGGLCILRGCMPTKAMLESAHAAHEPTRAADLGVRFEGRMVPDFARIMERKDALVARFQRAKIASVEKLGCELIRGRARFAPGGRLEVDGRTLRARSYVIATGSVPVVPEIVRQAGVPALTSDDVMRLTEPPGSLIVWGAGPVGLELGQFFARIGSEVTVVNRSPLLSRFDPDCGAELAAALNEEDRLRILAPAGVLAVRRDGGAVAVAVETAGGARQLRAEALLVATGRRPALDGLRLELAGVEQRDGAVPHDETMRTSNPSIYVAGDATGRFQILHLANQEGAVAGHNAAGGTPPQAMDYRLKMWAIFTDPPFACIGMSAREVESARAAGRSIACGEARLPETGRAITMNVRHGIWKLYADATTGEILGSSIVGPRADDLIHIVASLMHFRGSVEDVRRMPWYHPTLSEVMLNLERSLAECIRGAEKAPPPPA